MYANEISIIVNNDCYFSNRPVCNSCGPGACGLYVSDPFYKLMSRLGFQNTIS